MHGRMHAQLLHRPALPCSRAAIYSAVVQRSTLAARCAAQADPAGPAAPSKDAEHAAKAGWDPEGLFSSASPLPRPSGDLFAARAARRAAHQKQQRHKEARLQAEQAQQAAAAAAVPQAVNVQAEPAAVELGMARSVGAPQEPASSERPILPGPPDRQVSAATFSSSAPALSGASAHEAVWVRDCMQESHLLWAHAAPACPDQAAPLIFSLFVT